jgi:hypothetical protein
VADVNLEPSLAHPLFYQGGYFEIVFDNEKFHQLYLLPVRTEKNNRGVTAALRGALPDRSPIAEIVLRAACAHIGQINRLSLYPRFFQLLGGDLPKVKMAIPHHKPTKVYRQLLFVVYELGTAWTERWADTRLQMSRVGAKVELHLFDGRRYDVGHAAPPAVVNRRDCIVNRIKKQHCLTVRLLDHQRSAWLIADQRIEPIYFMRVINFAVVHVNPVGMYLAGAEQPIRAYPVLNSGPVLLDICRIVSGTVTHIEAFIGTGAYAVVSGEEMIGDHRFFYLLSVSSNMEGILYCFIVPSA